MDKYDAHDIVRSIFKVELTPFVLVTCAQHKRIHGSFRSEVYKKNTFLCYEGSTPYAGGLLCIYYLKGICSILTALLELNMTKDTSTLSKYIVDNLKQKFHELEVMNQRSIPDKERVLDAELRYVVLGHLPLSVTYNQA